MNDHGILLVIMAGVLLVKHEADAVLRPNWVEKFPDGDVILAHSVCLFTCSPAQLCVNRRGQNICVDKPTPQRCSNDQGPSICMNDNDGNEFSLGNECYAISQQALCNGTTSIPGRPAGFCEKKQAAQLNHRGICHPQGAAQACIDNGYASFVIFRTRMRFWLIDILHNFIDNNRELSKPYETTFNLWNQHKSIYMLQPLMRLGADFLFTYYDADGNNVLERSELQQLIYQYIGEFPCLLLYFQHCYGYSEFVPFRRLGFERCLVDLEVDEPGFDNPWTADPIPEDGTPCPPNYTHCDNKCYRKVQVRPNQRRMFVRACRRHHELGVPAVPYFPQDVDCVKKLATADVGGFWLGMCHLTVGMPMISNTSRYLGNIRIIYEEQNRFFTKYALYRKNEQDIVFTEKNDMRLDEGNPYVLCEYATDPLQIPTERSECWD